MARSDCRSDAPDWDTPFRIECLLCVPSASRRQESWGFITESTGKPEVKVELGGLALNPSFHFGNLQRVRFQPTPVLGMAIGDAEHAAVVVAGGGKIDPGPIAGLSDGQTGVFDAVFVLVEKHERLGLRSWAIGHGYSFDNNGKGNGANRSVLPPSQ